MDSKSSKSNETDKSNKSNKLNKSIKTVNSNIVVPSNKPGAYKKDYLVIIPNSDDKCFTSIESYQVFAVMYDGKTVVLIVIFRKDNPIPSIEYQESDLDPSILINNIYLYQVGRNRSNYLRKMARLVNNKNNLQDLNVVTDDRTNIEKNHLYEDIISDVDQYIYTLFIIVSNESYITTSSKTLINEAVNVMLLF